MEQHRVLLIIVSVCLFFAAVLGVGLWLFYPRSGTSPSGTPVAGTQAPGTTKEGKTGFDPIEYLRQGEQQQPPTLEQPQQKKGTGDVIIVYGNGQKGTESASGNATGTGAGAGGAAVPGGPPEVSSVPAPGPATPGSAQPSAAANAASRSAPVVATTPAKRSVPGLSAGERSESAGESRARAVTQVRTAARHQPVRPAVKTPSHEFWIQLLASTHRDTIESALGTLKQYSVNGHITTVSVGDRDFYRLRVGPYASKQEAEKFQSWIRDIKDFKDAYVSEVYNN